MKILRAFFLITLCVVTVSSCSSNDGINEQVLVVDSGTSIQKVVDEAQPGDVVLIESGTYEGGIVISTKDITLRGDNRNTVILNGEYAEESGIIVAADGVAIENLTVQSFTQDGISFRGGHKNAPDIIGRYSVQYVNALNNGRNGIDATSTTDGIIANNYATANTNAGIHIATCDPCRTIASNNVAEINGIGLQAVNTNKEMFIFNNTFSNNRAGMHLVSDLAQAHSPQSSAEVVGNITSHNNRKLAPTATPSLFGFGILISGGTDNTVKNNLATANDQVGIALLESGTLLPSGNTFTGNEARNNGIPVGFDLAYILSGRSDVPTSENCYENNSYSSSSVDHIEMLLPCSGAEPGTFKSVGFKTFVIPAAVDYTSIEITVQTREAMPGELDAIPEKLKKIAKPDLSDITLPEE